MRTDNASVEILKTQGAVYPNPQGKEMYQFAGRIFEATFYPEGSISAAWPGGYLVNEARYHVRSEYPLGANVRTINTNWVTEYENSFVLYVDAMQFLSQRAADLKLKDDEIFVVEDERAVYFASNKTYQYRVRLVQGDPLPNVLPWTPGR